MGHSKFKLDDTAFEASTRQVIQPHHVKLLQEEAGADTQFFQTPPGLPATQEELGEQAADAPKNPTLNCIMEDIDGFDSRDRLYAFQDIERCAFGINSDLDCDVPEDELSDDMEDTDSDQELPVILQWEKGQAAEGEDGQHSPENIPLDNTIAIEENIEPSAVNLHRTLVNVQVTELEDPRTPRHLDEMENTTAIDEDQLVPVNLQGEHFNIEDDNHEWSPGIITLGEMCSQEHPVNLQEEGDPTCQEAYDHLIPLEDITAIEKDQPDPVNVMEEVDPTEGNHDQPSRLGNIQLEDITATDEVQLIPVNLQEEDYGQPNPVIIPVVDSIAIEGNETSPGNRHLTVVSIQGIEPEDPSTPRRLDVSIATFDGTVYPEANPKVIPENQLDVKVQTVTATSTAEGESSNSSNLIPMDILYELRETVKGHSVDLPNVNETASETYN